MSGIAAVQGRIAALQSRIDNLSGVTPTRTVETASAGAAPSTGFATALSAALGTSSSTALGTSGTAAAGIGQVSALGAAGASTLGGLGLAGAQPGAGSAVVEGAMKYLGVPYVWGGETAFGMDCSGLVQRVFADLGVTVPRVARAQATVGTEIPSLAQARPGDLIVTRGGAHIAIYLGDNKIIHAPQPGENVSIREMFETDADILTIRRVLPAAQEATAVDYDRLALQLASGGAL